MPIAVCQYIGNPLHFSAPYTVFTFSRNPCVTLYSISIIKNNTYYEKEAVQGDIATMAMGIGC